MDPHVRSEKHGALGLLILDRPKALNALTHGMILAVSDQLQAWAGDDGIKTVAIRGAGDRAFCAGGDIRMVQQAAAAGSDDRMGSPRERLSPWSCGKRFPRLT